MLHQTSLLYLLAALPSALSITTIQAYLAPVNAGASVLAVAPSATTYSIICTSLCASKGDFNQATLVDGPATAGFTNIMEGGQKTFILDCKVNGQDSTGDCTTKAISAGQTVTVTEALSMTKQDVVITAGVELLGYAVVTTTAEVNVTSTATTITSGTETVTSGVPKTTNLGSASSARLAASTASRSTNAAGVAETTSSKAAAPTLAAQKVGAALVGLAGFMMVVL